MSFRKRLSRLFDFLLDVRVIGSILLIIALLIGGVGYIQLHGTFDTAVFLSDFYANLAAEFASIGITVLIIDSLNRRRERKRDKKEKLEGLIRDLRSGVKDSRDRALHEMKERGWFEDGSLVNAHLEGVDLSGAKLRDANLSGAKLEDANLSGANLWSANLSNTEAHRVNLSGADLSEARLYGANLSGADLSGADLWSANLFGSNLERANLSGANLQDANLKNVNLLEAQFDEATILPNTVRWRPEHHEHYRLAWWEDFGAVMFDSGVFPVD